jgi:trk system potassium uptake protein TrkH
MGEVFKFIYQSPARVSVIYFLLLILGGTLLLLLPVSSQGPSVGFVNTLFTATSAACVTGLTVVDMGTTFTVFGQIVILLLIQIGGVGIMTLSTVFVLISGGRLSLVGHFVIQDTFTHSKEMRSISIVKNVFLMTFLIEGTGAALLFFRFLPGNTAGRALYLAIFHSVSAFCNAGFALFPDNLAAFKQDWLVNFVVCFLIVSGGIGFLVLSELKRQYAGAKQQHLNIGIWPRLSLHTKLVLSTTLILIIVGTVMILIMEWSNTLSSMTIPVKVLAAFFQSITTRTAGFNTITIGDMTNISLFTMIILMFIGASPGSCAGGIKTTTFSTLVLRGLASFAGRERPQVFHRTIPTNSVWKAISVTMVSIFLVVIGTMLLSVSELGGIPHQQSRGTYIELLFEVVSAFGTVGLSTGVTGNLTVVGKLIITIIMFLGRLGPLVVAIALSRQKTSSYYYAEENIMVG